MSDAILVTGASGFIGRTLVHRLQELNYNVVTHSSRSGNPIESRGVSHVFHLAAKTYVPESWSDPVPFYQTNVMGTVEVLEYCRQQQAPVTLVSSYVYGRPVSLPISEESLVQAFNPYGHTKILAEQVGQFYASTFGVSVTIVRPFNVYGPLQDARFLIPTILRQAVDPSTDVISVADLRPRRDLLYITDFVELLVRCIGRKDSSMAVFNAGSGTSNSIQEICDVVNSLSSKPKQLISRGEFRPDDVLDVVADISKARAQLGWQPNISLKRGLELSLAAMKERRGGEDPLA